MFYVLWTPEDRASNHGHREEAGPFESRNTAERFVIELPHAIDPSKERLTNVCIVERDE